MRAWRGSSFAAHTNCMLLRDARPPVSRLDSFDFRWLLTLKGGVQRRGYNGMAATDSLIPCRSQGRGILLIIPANA